MRNLSLLGLLIVVAIIGYLAKSMLSPLVSHNPNDQSTVEYWVAHDADRAAMLSWCQNHPDKQDSAGCNLAVAAQTEVDSKGHAGQAGQSGVDQGTSGAADQLQAQQDANTLP